jgi:hypothetical protein
MKHIYTLLLLTLILNESFAQRDTTTVTPDKPAWIFVGGDNSDTDWWIKSEYASKDFSFGNPLIKIWTKRYEKTSKIKNTVYKNVKVLMLQQFDCKNKKHKILSVVYYNSAGKVIETASYDEYVYGWDDVVPETMGEIILNKVCEMFGE